jgi:hypothetical protein
LSPAARTTSRRFRAASPTSGPRAAKLAARRLMFHSHAAGAVSSKSFKSNTRLRSGRSVAASGRGRTSARWLATLDRAALRSHCSPTPRKRVRVGDIHVHVLRPYRRLLVGCGGRGVAGRADSEAHTPRPREAVSRPGMRVGRGRDLWESLCRDWLGLTSNLGLHSIALFRDRVSSSGCRRPLRGR